jgi:Spy/CpxP family protein refolding chaperone
MKKRHVMVITLSSLLLFGGLAACRHHHRPGGFDEFDLEAAVKRIASRLDLSDSQQEQLQTIATELAAKAGEMHADRETRHQELAELVRRDTIDRETAERMIVEKFEKMKELADLAADRLLDFHASLTPEQREKVAERIEEHASRRRCFFRR